MRLYEYSVIIGSFVATGTEAYLEFYPNQSATSNEEVTNYYEIQLELGFTATPYEPFVPNSPSPDYPSAIVNSGGYLVLPGLDPITMPTLRQGEN